MPDWFTASGAPGQKAGLDSAPVRTQLAAIAVSFGKLPVLAGNALYIVRVNAAANALESVNTIDAVVIGDTTPAAGTFTGLTATGASTFGGTATFNGAAVFNGNVTIGNAPGDTLTVAPNAVTWSGNPTHSGTHTFTGSVLVPDNGGGAQFAAGWRGKPVNSQSISYGLVISDDGKFILHPVSDNNSRAYTIPANASVAYPIGTEIEFVNEINTVSIAITTDTLTLSPGGTTGVRTLAASGVARARKVASTRWIISGTGLT